MKRYFKANLKIGHIKLSKSLVRYLILFILKKDSKL